MTAPINARLVATIPSRCVLGEGPVWDDRLGCLWFTDIQRAELLRWDHGAGQLTRLALPERLGSLALTDDLGVLLAALASGFALLRPGTGQVDWLHRVEPEYRGVRLNDGRVDRQGRFWAGSMVEREDGAPAERGTLWRLDPPGTAAPKALRDGISISNSICFSPDGAHAYFSDTPTRQILRYAACGDSLGTPTLFAETEPDCWPDGADVDADGRLWNAEWGAARITCYTPDGRVAGRLPLPVSQPTCVAFGGTDLDLMFVTSASEGLAAGSEPEAGNLLIYEGGFKGLPAGRFRLAGLAAAMLLAATALLPARAEAAPLVLDPVFGDHAVLQRGQKLPVHGVAAPGARITVRLAGAEAHARADRDGRWLAELPPLPASKGGDLVAEADGERAIAHDVAVGELFLCSGQSNMEFALNEAVLPQGSRQNAADAGIRLFEVAHQRALTPRPDFATRPAWQPALQGGPEFSAICLLFGRAIATRQNVTVGLIGSHWGGTPIEAWLPAEAPPALSRTTPAMNYAPGELHNAMIEPLGRMAMAGALWYQGENNGNQGDGIAAYKAKLKALLAGWRSRFGAQLPAIIIQLASFGPRPNPARDEGWARVREAQRQFVAEDPRSALVVTIDVGERLDIHPPLKAPVAMRAVQAARRIIYGEAVAPSGPQALAASRTADGIAIRVADVSGALAATGWGRPGPFMLCRGEDCRFADGEFADGGVKILDPPGFVADRVRYCWGGAPQCNVHDGEMLPLGPFELAITAGKA